MGSGERAQGPVCPQPVLRAALGAAPDGSAGGAGHHGPPHAHPALGPPPLTRPLPLEAEGSGPLPLLLFLNIDPWVLSEFALTLLSGSEANPGGAGSAGRLPGSLELPKESHTGAGTSHLDSRWSTPVLEPSLPASAFRVPAWVSSQECRCDPVPKAGEGGGSIRSIGQRLPPCLRPGLADWQPWAFEPREEAPPPVCASAAWPTSGLELARLKLLTPLGFSSRGPGANPSPFHQRKGDEHSTASGHCAGFRGWCSREHPREDQRQEPLRHCVRRWRTSNQALSWVGAKDGDRQVKGSGRVRGPGWS